MIMSVFTPKTRKICFAIIRINDILKHITAENSLRYFRILLFYNIILSNKSILEEQKRLKTNNRTDHNFFYCIICACKNYKKNIYIF